MKKQWLIKFLETVNNEILMFCSMALALTVCLDSDGPEKLRPTWSSQRPGCSPVHTAVQMGLAPEQSEHWLQTNKHDSSYQHPEGLHQRSMRCVTQSALNFLHQYMFLKYIYTFFSNSLQFYANNYAATWLTHWRIALMCKCTDVSNKVHGKCITLNVLFTPYQEWFT